jgi:hypothetical protein
MPPTITQQVFWLLILAIPIACIARTVVYEEVFREPREWCVKKSHTCRSIFQRKFFYLFTCEYCFSHWVTLIFVALTNFKLLIDDWRGYIIAFFALVFVANAYMNLYARLRVDITAEKKEIEAKERQVELTEKQIEVTEKELKEIDKDSTPPARSPRPRGQAEHARAHRE